MKRLIGVIVWSAFCVALAHFLEVELTWQVLTLIVLAGLADQVITAVVENS
jgi:hypothetical protein